MTVTLTAAEAAVTTTALSLFVSNRSKLLAYGRLTPRFESALLREQKSAACAIDKIAARQQEATP